MTTAVDFQQIKASVTIEQVADMLGVELRPAAGKLRGKCPICKCDDARMFVITPAKQLFFCFSEKKGGDAITLVERTRKCTVKEAAETIAAHFGAGKPNGSPSPGKRRKGSAASMSRLMLRA